MKLLKAALLCSTLLTLGGCSVFSSFSEVEALNKAQPAGSPFTQALALGYRDFANDEQDRNFDYPDALHFARKGLAAASGALVLPEPLADWNLRDEYVDELSAARARLMTAFDKGGREIAPALAARAQVNFDCWIENQEEAWEDQAIEACKSLYVTSVQQMEAQIAALLEQQKQIEISQTVDPGENVFDVDTSQPMIPENAMYLVFFNWDQADLEAGAQGVVDAVSTEVSANPPEKVMVIGHTDTSGPKAYNQRLAFKRATAVKDALVKAGVDAGLIAVDARGEEDPLVPTGDNVREPANRRVNISFQ